MTTSSADTTLSNQIYLSRDNIRTQIIEYMQYYLELENVDLVKSSFLSFMIDTLATLTTNILFYSSSTYKEFFLTTAQLPETIYNLSAFLGYNTVEATYSTANVLLTFPLTFTEDTKFRIPEGFVFKAGTVDFTTYYETDVSIVNNSSVVATIVIDASKTYNIPIVYDTTSAEHTFSFVLPVYQYNSLVQEFQIDSDVQLYQFITIDVPLNGKKLSSISVRVKDPGSTTWRTYTEFNSVYLMLSTDYGFVSRTISTGRRLTFGNGLIGVQPLPGSTVEVTALITEGLDGNVIPASITNGDRIYSYSPSPTKLINYSVTNPSPATGGADEESIQEVRANAIASLVALHRLTSEYDYEHAGVIVPTSNLSNNTIPVLKRSDVKCNEIQLFTAIEFGTSSRTDPETGDTITTATLVPTRNENYTVDISQTYIPRDTVITFNSEDYYTLFDMTIDPINLSAYYTYILYEVDIVPSLLTSYGIIYDLVCSNLNVSKVGNTADFKLSYSTTETDFSLCTAKMIVNSTLIYDMINDPITKEFTYTFNPYTLFPADNQVVEFTIYNSSAVAIATYSSEVTFRKTLDNFMMSNVSVTGSNVTVYDIPVILKTYYDSIIKKDFEATVLQSMMNDINFSNYKMLTDFTNLKFINTYGTMTNMQYNPVTKNACEDIGVITPPTIPGLGSRYIIGYTETGDWANKNGQIAQCIDATNVTWYYFVPTSDDIVYVNNTGKKYIYNGNKWILMEYQCPLQIEVEVFKVPNYYGSDVVLSNLVKDTLLDTYQDRFGPNISLYRSEIIRTVQNIEGVSHCNLIKPESNIFFEFDLQDLTQQELLEYGPEYVYFTIDTITVKVYT